MTILNVSYSYDRCFSAKCSYHMCMDPFECGILAALAIVWLLEEVTASPVPSAIHSSKIFLC